MAQAQHSKGQSMSDTPLLVLPYLSASQAQKHVTHNEALSLIDGIIHLSVISRTLVTPPPTPIDGDRYLIAAIATGAWAGHSGQVTLRMEGAWRFLQPRKGWVLWVESESTLLVFDGTNWLAPSSPSSLQNLSLLGVNATADLTNKLAVSSSSVLFSNAGAGMQFKVNKNAVTDTASILLQTGFSGRAEIGTTGDDNLHIKVSANGSSFNESLVVSGVSGLVTIKNNAALDPQSADPLTPANGQLWYNSTTGKFRGYQNGAAIDITGASSVSDGTKGDIVVSAGGTIWSVSPTSVTNAKLSTMASFTLKGNNTASAATPIDLTAAQVKSLLALSSADISGLGTLAAASSVNLSTQAAGTLQAAQEPAHTGDVTNVAGSLAFTITNSAVTNAKLANMASLTFKANTSPGPATPIDATADQMLVALNSHGHLHARSLILA
jgi:Protein of unknown function (DUF2793)